MARFLWTWTVLCACGAPPSSSARIPDDPSDLCWLVEQPADCLDDSDGVFAATFDATGAFMGSLRVSGLDSPVIGHWEAGHVQGHGLSGTYFTRGSGAGGFTLDVQSGRVVGEVVGSYVAADAGNGLVVGRFLLREEAMARAGGH